MNVFTPVLFIVKALCPRYNTSVFIRYKKPKRGRYSIASFTYM